jgi:hypothetical protein
MIPARHLLRIDSLGGLAVGAMVLPLSPWLSTLYAVPQALVVGMGVANLAYGTMSGLLHRRAERPAALIRLLVAANALWGVLCLITAVTLASTASVFGLATLVGEGLYVGGLAVLEWRAREALRYAA